MKILIAVLALSLTSCTATGSRQVVPLPSQDVELSNATECRIYVARTSQARGKLRSVKVFESNKEIGVIGANDYLCWERRPGRTIMRLVFEGRAIDAGDVESLVSVETKAGDVLYYEVDLARKVDDPDIVHEWGKPIATLLSAEAGRALIEQRDAAPAKR